MCKLNAKAVNDKIYLCKWDWIIFIMISVSNRRSGHSTFYADHHAVSELFYLFTQLVCLYLIKSHRIKTKFNWFRGNNKIQFYYYHTTLAEINLYLKRSNSRTSHVSNQDKMWNSTNHSVAFFFLRFYYFINCLLSKNS